MNKRTLWLTAVMVCAVLVLAAAGYGFDFSELESKVQMQTLDNGLKVIVMERHEAPVASFITYANVGGVNDPKGYTGLAHMFEHMAFKGTTTLGTTDLKDELKEMRVEDSIFALLKAERLKGRLADSAKIKQLEQAFSQAIDSAGQFVVPNAFDNIMEREGAVGTNAGTGMDQTIYMLSLPSNKVELWMAMESERFLNPVLREMYRERNVIAEERRQTLENNPIRRLLTAMTAAAFVAHPYHVPIVGYMSDIQNYTRAAALAYFKKYYVPSNMAIAVVGDVNPDDVFKLAKKYWGRIPYSPPPEPLNTVEPKQEGEREVILEDPAQPFLAIAWHIPAETDPDFPAIEAMMDHLGQGPTSMLYETMVKKDKIAADVASFAGYPGTKYPTLAVAYAIPASGHSNEECETAILGEIKKMQETPLSAEDVEHIKARAKAQFINSLTSNMGMAMRLATYEMRWGDWRELFRELDRINAVTADDIQRVANKYFTDENRTVAMLNTIQS